jgi:hypothetical protein
MQVDRINRVSGHFPSRANPDSDQTIEEPDRTRDNYRRQLMQDIAKSTCLLADAVNSDGTKAVFFLDRSARLAASAVKATLDYRGQSSELCLDFLNPSPMVNSQSNIKSLLELTFQNFNRTKDFAYVYKLLESLARKGLANENVTSFHPRKQILQDLTYILYENLGEAFFMDYVQRNLIQAKKVVQTNNVDDQLNQKIKSMGLNSKDKVRIYDVCKHNGETIGAVESAFKRIGFNNVESTVLYDSHSQAGQEHFGDCYAYDRVLPDLGIAVEKPASSINSQVIDPRLLQKQEAQIYTQTYKFLEAWSRSFR